MHILKAGAKTGIPKNVIYFDTETKTQYNEKLKMNEEVFRLGVAEYCNYDKDGKRLNKLKPFYFNNIHDFWDYIIRKAKHGKTLFVIAHNLDFDFEISRIFDLALREKWKIKFFAIAQGVFTWKFKSDHYSITFMDSMQFYHSSLRAIGKLVGLQKFPQPTRDMSDDSWFKYCQRDVDVLRVGMERLFKFILDNNLGKFSLTIAGQALRAFSTKFMDHKIVIHQKPWITDREIQAYHGGRTEAFYIGQVKDDEIYDLDVNSLYPYIMKKYSYPTEYITRMMVSNIDEMKKLVTNYCVIADVDIFTDEPYLPYKDKKLIFPTGIITGWYTTPEIKYAIDHDQLLNIRDVIVYKKAKIFESYVDYFYQLKQKAKKENDPVTYKMTKLFLNSLYGKFGQRVYKYKKEKTDQWYEPFIEQILSYGSGEISYRIYLGDSVYTRADRQPSYNTFVAIAAHVTAYARMHMWKLIKQAGRENVLYMDTDSLFVTNEGMINLQNQMNDYKLGYLKIEKKLHNLKIYGLKDYEADEVVRIKGVKASAEKIGKNRFKQLQFMKFRSRIHKGIKGTIPTFYQVKELKRVYDKGKVTPTGRVKPYSVGRDK